MIRTRASHTAGVPTTTRILIIPCTTIPTALNATGSSEKPRYGSSLQAGSNLKAAWAMTITTRIQSRWFCTTPTILTAVFGPITRKILRSMQIFWPILTKRSETTCWVWMLFWGPITGTWTIRHPLCQQKLWSFRVCIPYPMWQEVPVQTWEDPISVPIPYMPACRWVSRECSI